MLIDDPRQLLVDFLTRGQEIVQLLLAQHAAQRRLRHLRGRVEVVLHADHRLVRVEHTEEDDGVDLDRHVVLGDDILRRHVHGDGAEADLDHLVHEGDQEEEPGPRAVAAGIDDGAGLSAEPKDDRPLVLAQDPHRIQDDEEGNDGNGDEPQGPVESEHLGPPRV